MINGTFTQYLLLALAAILIVAAVIDMRTFKISNRLNLAVALLAPVYWVAVGLSPWPDIAAQIGVGVAVFAVLAGVFYLGMMGGGDVKLAAALALWFPPLVTLKFLVVMSIAGGVLTVVVIALHIARRSKGRIKVPYGVAIAFGGLVMLAQTSDLTILTQRFLNQFA